MKWHPLNLGGVAPFTGGKSFNQVSNRAVLGQPPQALGTRTQTKRFHSEELWGGCLVSWVLQVRIRPRCGTFTAWNRTRDRIRTPPDSRSPPPSTEPITPKTRKVSRKSPERGVWDPPVPNPEKVRKKVRKVKKIVDFQTFSWLLELVSDFFGVRDRGVPNSSRETLLFVPLRRCECNRRAAPRCENSGSPLCCGPQKSGEKTHAQKDELFQGLGP